MSDGAAAAPEALAAFEQTTEYANYFVTYGFLYHQKQMLEDHSRMVSYRDAILGNRERFEGKVVLDVGTGSGVLAIWSAQAGARKVYAVEATDAAKYARMVVAANGMSGVIEVIQGKMEDVTLPEQVDVIVSEWMGYMLLRESMLDSVIYARDRWLKPGGALYPSSATMYLAPIQTSSLQDRSAQLSQSMQEWASFVEYMRAEHAIALDCLNESYEREHGEYYLRTAQWQSLDASTVVGRPCAWHTFDVGTVTVDELKRAARGPFTCTVLATGPVQALAGWFDVRFEGSTESPAVAPVVLSTAPECGYTHWGQQVFLLVNELQAQQGDVIAGEAALTRQPKNERTLHLDLTYALRRHSPAAPAGEEVAPQVSVRHAID